MCKSLATWFTPSLQAISRSAGRSSVAAAAYRACVKLTDQLTGLIHDYTRKSGHVDTILIGASSISELWNKAEAAENRRNSTVARELMLPLPDAWTDDERRACVRDIAQHLRDTYGVAVVASIHGPSRHDRNNHVHMMFTTREVDELGKFGKKTRILDEGLKNGEIKNLREAICKIVNSHAEKLGYDFYVYAGKFSEINKNHIPAKRIPINAGKEYRNFVTARNVQIKIHLANESACEKKAELLQAELANASILAIPERTPTQSAPTSVDVEKVKATRPASPEIPFKRKKIPIDCEKAYQRHQDILKKRAQLEQLYEKWHKKHTDLLANEPSCTQRLFSKIGIGAEKIERYDLELSQATKALSNIAHNENVYRKILSEKNSLELVEKYNAIIDHNAKISECEAEVKNAHAVKLKHERELREEQARQSSEPDVDWTFGYDPAENDKQRQVETSNDLSY